MGSTSTIHHATPVPQEEPREEHPQAHPARVMSVLETETTAISMPEEEVFLKGEAQPVEYRDWPFALVFVAQIVAIVSTAIALAPAALASNDYDTTNSTEPQSEDPSDPPQEYSSTTTEESSSMIWIWLLGTLISAVSVVGLALCLMMRYPHQMVRAAFFTAPAILCSFAVAVALDPEARADGLPVVYATAAAFMGCFSLCFYLFFKRFMPFAASTLRTALTAVQQHAGLLLVSLANGFVAVVWMFVWIMAYVGIDHHVRTNNPPQPCVTYDEQTGKMVETGELCEATPNAGVVLLMILAFYWTHQVIQNVLHVTTAGTVGTWWFTEEKSANRGCCGWSEVGHSLYRSMTYSFGSICFGSLLIALLQTLESMLRSARRNRRGSALLLCILECLVHILRRWLEYFNSWAMVYVALYGYDYLTAGRNVVALFKTRGWTTFISDRLVFRVLLLCHVSIGLLVGFASALLDGVVGPVFDNDTFTSHFVAFGLGTLVGLYVSSTVLFVVESAVRTSIVCFAESPNEFQMNHPALCTEMIQGWSETYPDAWAARRHVETAIPMATARVSHAKEEHEEEESQNLV